LKYFEFLSIPPSIILFLFLHQIPNGIWMEFLSELSRPPPFIFIQKEEHSKLDGQNWQNEKEKIKKVRTK
jgi:hypothetical protein